MVSTHYPRTLGHAVKNTHKLRPGAVDGSRVMMLPNVSKSDALWLFRITKLH